MYVESSLEFGLICGSAAMHQPALLKIEIMLCFFLLFLKIEGTIAFPTSLQ